MRVIIYQPVKNAMQSGKAKNAWIVRFEEESSRFIEPLMGWTGASDNNQELNLKFSSLDKAIAYAKSNKLEYHVIKPNQAKLKLQSYASNFQ